MLLTGADIIVECLLEQGVNTVFGYPGGSVLNIYDSLYMYSDKIRHVITAHEQAACHAADGFSRTTGKTGVVIATSGPGATNLVTGIATAYMDSIPMVAITGNVATPLLGLDSFQEVDICGITMPVTKHNYIVKDINKLADTIREAFYIANEGRKGPVLIDVPKDVTAAKCEFIRTEPEKIVNHNPEDINSQIEAAAKLIKAAERPMIYAGGGVVSCDAAGEMAIFAEKCDAPVSLSLMGQCAFDNTKPAYTGMLGMHGTKTSAMALGECDLLIVLGSRFSDRVLCNAGTFAKDTKIVHIEIDPAEIGKNINVDAYVAGDLKYVLAKLNEILPDLKHSEWMEKIAEWKNKYALKMVPVESEDEVLPQDVIETLDKLTSGEAIITTEVGQHQMWAAQYFTYTKPRRLITSGGLGTMGFGLGAAIGTQIAHPESYVFNIAGDGSFRMNFNELLTASKYNIPVCVVIANNGVLGMVRQWQTAFYSKRYSQTILDKELDYAYLAKACHVDYYYAATKEEYKRAIEEVVKKHRPCIINAMVEIDEKVLPMVAPGKPIDDIMLK